MLSESQRGTLSAISSASIKAVRKVAPDSHVFMVIATAPDQDGLSDTMFVTTIDADEQEQFVKDMASQFSNDRN